MSYDKNKDFELRNRYIIIIISSDGSTELSKRRGSGKNQEQKLSQILTLNNISHFHRTYISEKKWNEPAIYL